MDGFDPGMIISDANFTNVDSETAPSLQAFLEAKGSACVENPTTGLPCLKDYTADTPAVAANEFCDELAASGDATAAEMISAVSTACGLNPQVTVVMLQKEQGLVTASGSGLTTAKYLHATGVGCPDYMACDPNTESFFRQVYGTAQLFAKYRAYPTKYNYRPGPVQVPYNPESTCGKASFTIANQSTASLYNYTPYVPNAAAIANSSGVGDLCSAYGNRTFYRQMRAWFPASVTASTAAPIVPSPPSTITAGLQGVYAEYERVGGSATLGAETSQVTCTSTDTGPCTKKYRYGTVTWASSTGGHTDLDKAIAPAWSRWAGPDRYATSATISANYFEAGPGVVFIANGEDFADALSGGAAAHQASAPLLLTQTDGLPSATAAELERLAPGRIVVLGGPGAVSDAVVAELSTFTTGGVSRLWGADRYATAVAIASATFPSGAGTLTIASGTTFPDALSAANLFADHPGPVLMSGPDGLDAATLAEVARPHAGEAFVVGGPGAVPDATVAQLEAAGLTVTRLWGSDRYATNVAIDQFAYSGAVHVYLASGEAFPDGLTAGVPAALGGAPLVLVNPTCVPIKTALYLKALQPDEVTMLGGTAALSDSLTSLPLC
jgi:putative cell wall-binding protein